MKRRIYLLLASGVVIIALMVLLSNGFNSKLKNTTNTASVTNTANTANTAKTTNSNNNLAFNVEFHPEYNVAEANDLYNKADLVFTGKYLKDNKAFVERDLITTEATFHVNKVLKGSISKQELNDGLNIMYYGGEMLLGDYLDQLDKQDPRYSNVIKNFTEDDRKTKKVTTKFKNQANKTKDKNIEYLIFASYNSSTKTYQVLSDEFGMRKIDNKGNVFNPASNQYEKVDFYPAK